MVNYIRGEDGIKIELSRHDIYKLRRNGKIEYSDSLKIVVNAEDELDEEEKEYKPVTEWSKWSEPSVPKYGQVNIPKEIRDPLGISEGDVIQVQAEIYGNSIDVYKRITRNGNKSPNYRITIHQDERKELNIEPNEEVFMRVRKIE